MFSRYKLAKKFILNLAPRLSIGELDITFPEGDRHHFKGEKHGPVGHLHIHTQAGLMQIIKKGKLGFCEAYMSGDVTSQNIVDLIEMAVLNNQFIEDKFRMSSLSWFSTKLAHLRNRNSKEGSRRNISYHYDLGNDFYELWLDKTMTYSSAVFETENAPLTDAQIEKYRRLAEMAEIKDGDHVLEIGCGWGGFAEFAATEYDIHLTCITISQEQFDFACQRMAKQGLSDRVNIQLIDYRDLKDGSFDKIISIEMFEAVGMDFWPVYFNKLSSLLKPDGKAALQVITIDDSEFDSYLATPDFIQKYIFPGGMLPSMQRLDTPITNAGMKLAKTNDYGLHYAKTLSYWREEFLNKWPIIQEKQGFDKRFKNMWELYLAYCEGGFKSGMIDVKQMLLTRE